METFMQWLSQLRWYVIISLAQVVCVGMICMAFAASSCAKYEGEAKKARYENQYKSDEAFWGKNRKCECGCTQCSCRK